MVASKIFSNAQLECRTHSIKLLCLQNISRDGSAKSIYYIAVALTFSPNISNSCFDLNAGLISTLMGV